MLLLVVFVLPAQAQNERKDNLIDYDLEWIHYGFLIGVHQSKYRILYSDAYATPALDSLHSIVPNNTGGWKVGFVVDMALVNNLSFRILPTVGFYEYDITYRYTNGTTLKKVKPVTTVEVPLLLKYKSARRGNVAMYTVGGVNPQIEAGGKGDQFGNVDELSLLNFNFAVEAGVGFDLYFPLFKFSPEVRYSWGLRNMLPGTPNNYSVAMKRLTYQNITMYITFEGGPSYLRHQKRKKRKNK